MSMIIINLLYLFILIYMVIIFKSKKESMIIYTIISIIAVIYALLGITYGFTGKLVEVIFLSTMLSIISLIDIRYEIIPDSLIGVILIFGILFNIINKTVTVKAMIIGFFIISVPLLVTAIIVKDSIGGGDIKLMAVTGAFLGWKFVILAFLIASVIGGIVSTILLIIRKIKKTDMIPYGPFLSIGIIIAILCSNKIIG